MKSVKWKSWLADYLSFSRKERWAVLLLVVLVLALFILPDYLPAGKQVVEVPDTLINRLMADWSRSDSAYLRPSDRAGFTREQFTGSKRTDSRGAYRSTGSRGGVAAGRFYFDPNTVDEGDLKRLGIPAKTAATMVKYREKGGRFRTAEDLRKIYSLPAWLADELIPWVRIESGKLMDYGVGGRRPGSSGARAKGNRDAGIGGSGQEDVGVGTIKQEGKGEANSPEQLSGIAPDYAGKSRSPKIIRVRINEADSLAWLALPGIGPRLAGRILHFRSRLGGFTSVEQVGEVYGLADSVFRRIQPLLEAGTQGIQPLNLNTATREELAAHPYIKWQLATAIVQYRSANGAFRQVDELLRIHLISEELFRKMAPYCKID